MNEHSTQVAKALAAYETCMAELKALMGPDGDFEAMVEKSQEAAKLQTAYLDLKYPKDVKFAVIDVDSPYRQPDTSLFDTQGEAEKYRDLMNAAYKTVSPYAVYELKAV